MTYSISSISNRDTQLLHCYRILRQPAEFLGAVYTGGVPEELHFTPGNPIVTEGGDETTLYTFITSARVPENKVPLLEFYGDDEAWAKSAYLTQLLVEGQHLTLYSTRPSIEGLGCRVYWLSSISTVEGIISSYKEELQALADELEELKKSGGDTVAASIVIDGVPDNLIKIDDAKKEGTNLTDSEYRIASAVPSQKIVEPSKEDLARMIKTIGGDLHIVSTNKMQTLQGLSGSGRITISGSGTWYLIDVTNDVVFQYFTGNIYAINCPAVRTWKGTNIGSIQLANSILIHNQGNTGRLTLTRRSLVKHNSGSIKTLVHVGVGCEYYSQTSTSNEPTFEWNQIQGTVCLSAGRVLMNGREVSFITGHHDDPFQPSKLEIVVDQGDPGDSGTGGGS